MKIAPIVVMPNIDSTSTPVDQLLKRQDLYFSYLLKESQGNERALVFFSAKSQIEINESFDAIKVIRIGKGRFHWTLMSFGILLYLKRNKIRPQFLVAGTPFQPFFITLVLKLFFPSTKIQVAIHGEISGIKGGGLTKFLKYLFLRIFLRCAALVRFVTNKQMQDFSGILTQKQRVIVTPVPIDIPPDMDRTSSATAISFVGRIHSERGIEEWIDIVQSLPRIKKIVVGDGPERATMQKALPQAEFKGFLSGAELDSAWTKTKVLLSTAPYESYGIALREALLRGIPVVSRTNAGSRDLFNLAPDLIKLYTTKDEALAAIEDFLNDAPEYSRFVKFKEGFVRQQNDSLRALAQAWLAL